MKYGRYRGKFNKLPMIYGCLAFNSCKECSRNINGKCCSYFVYYQGYVVAHIVRRDDV